MLANKLPPQGMLIGTSVSNDDFEDIKPHRIVRRLGHIVTRKSINYIPVAEKRTA